MPTMAAVGDVVRVAVRAVSPLRKVPAFVCPSYTRRARTRVHAPGSCAGKSQSPTWRGMMARRVFGDALYAGRRTTTTGAARAPRATTSAENAWRSGWERRAHGGRAARWPRAKRGVFTAAHWTCVNVP